MLFMTCFKSEGIKF
ncbi:CLUMA_CG002691, isoform A [Clunio marinus]|uniref:CLUMA_CG002691, isoform A n=1 Tax=Clunio marinus TaxID=568069 RepID=A0A1J1HL60_9DIPT|nr:CLUMA_CG002691, isoform A [Clunio marinus]